MYIGWWRTCPKSAGQRTHFQNPFYKKKLNKDIPEWICTPSSVEVNCCFSSVCLCLPSHSHNAPAAALFNSLLSLVKSFRSSAMAISSLLICFLFSSSNANVHNVLQAFSLSSSVFAFCNIVTRTGMASHCTIYKHNIINDQLPGRLRVKIMSLDCNF